MGLSTHIKANTIYGGRTKHKVVNFLVGGDPQTLNKLSERSLITSSTTGDWIGRPSILNDGSKWIMVYRAGSQHGFDVNSGCHIRFSTNEGVTWTDENKFTDGESVVGVPFLGSETKEAGTPIIIKAPNGDLLVLCSDREDVYTISNVKQWRSENGGATWTDEGVIANELINMDAIIIGTDIYASAYTDGGNGQAKVSLWKSTDSGANWSKVGDVVSPAVDNKTVDECSICNPAENTIVIIMRDRQSLNTYVRISTDLGANWGSVLAVGSQIGVAQRPRLILDGTRIYVIARDYLGADVPNYTKVSYSDDGGETWYSGRRLEDSAQVDCGYGHILKRTDGKFYCVSYRGNYASANIYEYILEIQA